MEIWIFDLIRNRAERLTAQGENVWPVWTPDGQKVVFSSDRNGPFNLYLASVGEDVEPVRLTDSPHLQFAGSVSPDGRTVFYAELHPESRFDIWSVRLDGSTPPEPILDSRSDEFRPAISPDGRLLAYASNEAGRWDELGRWDIYVRPLDSPDSRIMVSSGGGTDPTWSRDGRKLFYRHGGKLLSVQIRSEPQLQVEAPQVELDRVAPPNPVAQVPHFDVAGDGRILVIDRSSRGDVTQLNVVLDWLRRPVE